MPSGENKFFSDVAGSEDEFGKFVGQELVEMTRRFFDGDVAGAAKLQCRLLPLMNALFSEVNPIPAKAAVSALGFGEDRVRLPLTPMEPAHREVLYARMKELGVLQ